MDIEVGPGEWRIQVDGHRPKYLLRKLGRHVCLAGMLRIRPITTPILCADVTRGENRNEHRGEQQCAAQVENRSPRLELSHYLQPPFWKNANVRPHERSGIPSRKSLSPTMISEKDRAEREANETAWFRHGRDTDVIDIKVTKIVLESECHGSCR